MSDRVIDRKELLKRAKKGHRTKKQKAGDVIVFVLLALGAVTMVFPLIYMVATSFMTKNQILSGKLTILPDPILIGKYSEVLSKGSFINGILNTMKVEIPVLFFGGFTSSLAAFAFAKMRFRGKDAFFMALLATIMIPFAEPVISTRLPSNSFILQTPFQSSGKVHRTDGRRRDRRRSPDDGSTRK